MHWVRGPFYGSHKSTWLSGFLQLHDLDIRQRLGRFWDGSVFSNQVEALLTIIALSIFADKRIFSSEISTFVDSAKEIQAHAASDLPVTEAKLLMWFEMNRMRLSDKIRLGPVGFQHWFESVIGELHHYPDKDFIMTMLDRIAHADGEFHVSERALSVLVRSGFQNQTEPA